MIPWKMICTSLFQDKSIALQCENFTLLAPVVQKVDNAIHWINHNPLDNSIGFDRVHLLDSDLSVG